MYKDLKLLIIGSAFCLSVQNLFAQTDSLGTVHFYRPRSMKGFLITYDLYYENKLVGTIKPGSTFEVKCKPGINKFRAKTESNESYMIDLKPGTVRYVKCGLSMGIAVGRPIFKEVNEKEGEKAVKKIVDRKSKKIKS